MPKQIAFASLGIDEELGNAILHAFRNNPYGLRYFLSPAQIITYLPTLTDKLVSAGQISTACDILVRHHIVEVQKDKKSAVFRLW